eukprot:c53663_g1_i1 orf=160-684(-)
MPECCNSKAKMSVLWKNKSSFNSFFYNPLQQPPHPRLSQVQQQMPVFQQMNRPMVQPVASYQVQPMQIPSYQGVPIYAMNPQAVTAARGNQMGFGRGRERGPVQCYICGELGHIQAKCPNAKKPVEYQPICGLCQTQGLHEQKDCLHKLKIAAKSNKEKQVVDAQVVMVQPFRL